jgi:hypothetical protein
MAAIHLTPVDPADPAGSYAKIASYRGEDAGVAFDGSGAIDHIAFDCEGHEEIKARLEGLKIPMVENAFPALNFQQIFIKDPNGITLELNFR